MKIYLCTIFCIPSEEIWLQGLVGITNFCIPCEEIWLQDLVGITNFCFKAPENFLQDYKIFREFQSTAVNFVQISSLTMLQQYLFNFRKKIYQLVKQQNIFWKVIKFSVSFSRCLTIFHNSTNFFLYKIDFVLTKIRQQRPPPPPPLCNFMKTEFIWNSFSSHLHSQY